MKKKIKNFFLSWPIQFGVILATFVLGFIGFLLYYSKVSKVYLTNLLVQTAFSTIKLFALSFDADTRLLTDPAVLELHPDFFHIAIILEIARWLALFVAGTALLRLLKPLFAHWQQQAIFRRWKRRREKILLIGNNEENAKIYDSAFPKDKKKSKTASLTGEPQPEKAKKEKKKNVFVINDTGCEKKHDEQKWMGYPCVNADGLEFAEKQVVKALRHRKSRTTIVINTHNEKRNLQICKKIVETIQKHLREDQARYEEIVKLTSDTESLTRLSDTARETLASEKLELERKLVSMLDRVHITVFGDQRYEGLYLELQRKSQDILRFANKYILSAFNFVFRFPLTRNLPKEWRRNGRVDEDVAFNVLFLGFGDTNANLYSAHRTVNQFVTGKPGQIPAHKAVNYHIFARDGMDDNGLNHTDLRFEKDFLKDVEEGYLHASDYLPLPVEPATTAFKKMDYNSPEFYREVRRIVTNSEKSINEIIICVGDDMENIDLAQKLASKKLEWGVKHLTIYAKVRGWIAEEEPQDYELAGFVPFGNETKEVFNLKTVWENPIIEMARKRNILYTIEASLKDGVELSDSDFETHANYLWYTMDPNQHMSNIYAILSLRFKMQLMGLNFHDMKNEKADRLAGRREIKTNDEYMAIYAKGDRPAFSGKWYKGMQLIDYPGTDMPEDFTRDILRRNLTVQEHLRWNAYMMSCGFIPASKKFMKEKGKAKSYELRLHGNLTPFEGLFDYRRLMAEIKGKDEASQDVICYDYQLMDTAWCFLHENGFRVHAR